MPPRRRFARFRLPGLWLFFLLPAACAFPVSPAGEWAAPRDHSLNGEWKFSPASLRPADAYLPETADEDWETIPVPANWHPVRGEHSGAAWYRLSFPAPGIPPDGVVRLHFQGVDYAADVWLNGRHLGFHEGRFAPFAFDATDSLRADSANLLAVRVDSPHEPVGRVWSLRKRLIKGIFNHHDTRPGGAWSPRGQDGNTGGIWGPVRLRLSRTLAIRRLAVRRHLRLSDATATPEAIVKLHRPAERTSGPVAFTATLRPEGAGIAEALPTARATVPVEPGQSTVRLRFPRTPVRLWHTWDTGTPHLYRLAVEARRNGQVLDREEKTIGFRELTMDPETFVVRLNGKRLFLRGTNYISDQWVSRMDGDDFDRDLSLMIDAHVNAVRVHAHVEPAEFYARCDRRGVLVWQDFPLQWGYSDAPEVRAEAVRQARKMVDFLDHHPSILVWCGHNEPPWEADWMRHKYPDYQPGQNRELGAAVTEALRAADPDRYVHPASIGEEHPWYGWYSGSWRDYRKPAKHPLITEFGAQALPELETLRRIVGDEALWPDTEAEWTLWEYHNFQRHETFNIAGVKPGKNTAEFIRNTQDYQARLIKTAAESYRRQRFAPVAGIFQFLFSENWPSMNWGMMDHLRRPKPGYAALRAAYQPVLPMVQWLEAHPKGDAPGPGAAALETPTVRLWVVNDRQVDYPDAVLFHHLDRNGEEVASGSMDLTVPADAARTAGNLRWTELVPGDYELRLSLRDAHGELLGLNRYPFRISGTDSPQVSRSKPPPEGPTPPGPTSPLENPP
ncbi:MAG: sugar-binding domain-containing protein [Desulfococcaceae bacterium]